MLKPSLKGLPVYISVEIEQDIQMHSKPGELTQVLTKLIHNAFSHGQGVNAKIQITVSGTLVSEKVVLSTVHDKGIGMCEQHVKHAYDPFFTKKMGKGGSGLGLNIVSGIVHGPLKGQVELTSTENVGTKLSLLLPLIINEQEAEAAPASQIFANSPSF